MHTLVPGTDSYDPCNSQSGRGERKIFIISPIKDTGDYAKAVTLGPWKTSGWGWLPEETTETRGWNVSPTPNFTEGRRAGQLVSSVIQSCPALCDPMDCSTPGFPVDHQLLGLDETHVHRVGDAIQPFHPLSSPSPPVFNLSQHQGLFQWVSSSH